MVQVSLFTVRSVVQINLSESYKCRFCFRCWSQVYFKHRRVYHTSYWNQNEQNCTIGGSTRQDPIPLIFSQNFPSGKFWIRQWMEWYITLAALISSSAKHSAIDLMFLKAASRAPVHSSQIAWFTRLSGDTSTACRLTVPARPIRVESSRGPLLIMALTSTCSGFYKYNNV